MFRKLLPHIFLGLFIVQMTGFSIYFNLEKAKIRKQLKSHLEVGAPKESMNTFEFSLREYSRLSWMKKDREFKLGRNYYDIFKKKSLKNGKLMLSCFSDKKESELFENLSHYVDVNLADKKSSHPLNVVFSIVQQPYLNPNSIRQIPVHEPKEKQKTRFHFIKGLESQVCIEILSPPPNRG